MSNFPRCFFRAQQASNWLSTLYFFFYRKTISLFWNQRTASKIIDSISVWLLDVTLDQEKKKRFHLIERIANFDHENKHPLHMAGQCLIGSLWVKKNHFFSPSCLPALFWWLAAWFGSIQSYSVMESHFLMISTPPSTSSAKSVTNEKFNCISANMIIQAHNSTYRLL